MKKLEYTIDEDKIPIYEIKIKNWISEGCKYKKGVEIREEYNLTPEEFEINHAVYLKKYKK